MKFTRDERGVSPVIATILMVSVTVVLAAVLYVMVAGMAGWGGDEGIAPAGLWRDTSPLSDTSAKLIFGTFQPSTNPISLRILLTDEHGDQTAIWWTNQVLVTNYTLTVDNANITAYYYDGDPAEGSVGGGDNIILYGLEPGTQYWLKVFHIPSSEVITMGGSTGFITAE